jgi:hypothetical protein
MPTAPQTIDMRAPTMKAIPVLIPYSVKKTMMRNMMKAKIRQMRYSTFKNSWAP